MCAISPARADSDEAGNIISDLSSIYNIHITRDWGAIPLITGPSIPYKDTCMWKEGNWKTLEELSIVKRAVEKIAPGKMTIDQFKKFFGYVRISRWDINKPGEIIPPSLLKVVGNKNDDLLAFSPPGILSSMGDIVLPNNSFTGGESYGFYLVIHELGHVWDYRTNNALSVGLMKELETWLCDDNEKNCTWHPYKAKVNPITLEIEYPEARPDNYRRCPTGLPNPDDQEPLCRIWPYSATKGGVPLLTRSGAEDWAQSFAGYVYPEFFEDVQMIGVQPGSIRYNYVKKAINNEH